MRKIFTMSMLMVACMMSTNLFATYYVVGNGSDDPKGNWCNGENWNVNADVNKLDENGSITFTDVTGGKNYGFKITDGSWGDGHEITTFDYENSDAPLYGGNGSDMGFTLSEDADVTVSLVDGKVRVQATKPLAYRSNYYYIAGNGDAARGTWCNQKDWNAGDASSVLVNDEISFTALPAQWYEFKITNGSWGKTWGYPQLDVAKSAPMHKTYGDNTNICFRLQAEADVTVKIEKGKVVLLIDRELCVTGNKELIGGETGWTSTTEHILTQGNDYTCTFSNLAVGEYKFKVKENVNDAWNDDCTWGYDHLDTENSNAGVNDGGNIAFTLTQTSNVTIALIDNKIRLTVTASSATAIDNVTLKNDGKYYDVLGRQIATPQKGNLYIHNGKKVIF